MIYKIVILGLIAVVTLAAKLPNSDRECVPGSTYKVKCNDCFCLENGSAICTLKFCLDLVQSPRLTSGISAGIVEETKCIPGERFEGDCGPCVCMMDGSPACSNKFCMS